MADDGRHHGAVRLVRSRVRPHPRARRRRRRLGARRDPQQHPEYGLRPVGFLDSRPLLPAEARPVPVLGGNGALAETVVRYGIEVAVIAFGSQKKDQLVEVIRTCDRLDCEIFFVPLPFELHAVGADMDHVWGFPSSGTGGLPSARRPGS